MNCITLSLALIAGLGVLLTYVSTTQSRALMLRDDMIDDVNAALQKPGISSEGRRAVLGLFHASILPGAVPRYVMRLIWYRLRNHLDDLDHGLTDADYSALSRLIRKHVLRINFVAGPHWYLLMAIVIAIIATAAAVAGHAFRWTDAQRQRLEHAFINVFADFAH